MYTKSSLCYIYREFLSTYEWKTHVCCCCLVNKSGGECMERKQLNELSRLLLCEINRVDFCGGKLSVNV